MKQILVGLFLLFTTTLMAQNIEAMLIQNKVQFIHNLAVNSVNLARLSKIDSKGMTFACDLIAKNNIDVDLENLNLDSHNINWNFRNDFKISRGNELKNEMIHRIENINTNCDDIETNIDNLISNFNSLFLSSYKLIKLVMKL